MAYAVETNHLRDAAAFAPGVLPRIESVGHFGITVRLCVPGGDDATDECVGFFATKDDAKRSLRIAGFVPLTGSLWRYQSPLED